MCLSSVQADAIIVPAVVEKFLTNLETLKREIEKFKLKSNTETVSHSVEDESAFKVPHPRLGAGFRC